MRIMHVITGLSTGRETMLLKLLSAGVFLSEMPCLDAAFWFVRYVSGITLVLRPIRLRAMPLHE